jgi:hypothetical protein
MSGFCCPIATTFKITSPFGFRTLTIDGKKLIDLHTGLDIGGVQGVPIYAIADGVAHSVKKAAAPVGSDPESIIIKHVDESGNFISNPWGFKYSLATHMVMGSCPFKNGDRIKKGQEIGKVGNTGRVSTGTHLHFELISDIDLRLQKREGLIDPLPFIRSVSSTVKEGRYNTTTDPGGAVPGSGKWRQGVSTRNVIEIIEFRTGIYSSDSSASPPEPLALPDGSRPPTYSLDPNQAGKYVGTPGSGGSGASGGGAGGAPAGLDDPNRKPAVRINEQAFLMLNWADYVQQSKSNPRFKQFAQIDHDDPAQLNNILFKKQPKFDILLNTKSVQMSYFVPRLRIFKEFVDSSSSVSKIVELPLSEGYTDYDLENIFKNSAGRGGGAGLLSFKWSTIGSNSGNKYSFGADLELFFESIEEITKQRWVGNEVISFADLLIQQKRKDSSGQYNPDYYRVKALVGWNSKKEAKEFLPIELIQEIEDSNLSLYLGLHSHEIDIADDSTVTLKIKFIAYLEALMDTPTNSNILYSEDKSLQGFLSDSRDSIEAQKQNKDEEGNVSDSAKESISTIEETMKKKELEDRAKVYQRILNYIRDKNFIKYVVATEEDVQTFMSLTSMSNLTDAEFVAHYNSELEKIRQNNRNSIGSSFSPSTTTNLGTPKDANELASAAQKSIEEYNSELAALQQKKPPGSKVIAYFYLGDLFEAVLSGMYNQEGTSSEFPSKQVKIFLGPVTFYDYGKLSDGAGGVVNKDNSLKQGPEDAGNTVKTFSGAKTVVNIADIPISLATYTNWFLKKIVDPGVTNMNFKDFVNAILNDLVIRSLGVETFSFAPRQKTRLVYKTKTLRRNGNRLPVLGSSPAPVSQVQSGGAATSGGGYRYQAIQFKENPFIDTSGIVDKEEKNDNFMFIYGVANNAWDLVSDYGSDLSKGIRHIQYGSETGLIKNIKFKRQDNPLIRTHNMKIASTGNSDKSIILREVYNADVEMMGNSIFEIGELVYVSPTLFGSSKKGANLADREAFAKELGIGGYFMILKINSSISQGSFNTSLELKWNAKGDGKSNNTMDGINSDGSPAGVKIQ